MSGAAFNPGTWGWKKLASGVSAGVLAIGGATYFYLGGSSPTPAKCYVSAPASAAMITGVTTLKAVCTSSVALDAIQVDGVPVGTGLSVSWDSSSYRDGSHNFAVVATSSSGATSTSATVAASTSNASARTANIWVSATGSDSGAACTRSASLITAPTPATVCVTLDKAVALAACGDTIGVISGSFGAQMIAYRSALNACAGSYVDIEPSGNVAFTGEVTNRATWLKFVGTAQTLAAMWGGARLGFDFQSGLSTSTANPQVTAAHDDYYQDINTEFFYISGAYDITMKGGQVGPNDLSIDTGGEDLIHSTSPYNTTTGTVFAAHNNTFDGIFDHDLGKFATPGSNSGHLDCIQTDGYMYLTVENSVFLNCANDDYITNIYSATSTYYSQFVSAGYDPLADATIENNWFEGGSDPQPIQVGSPAGADWGGYGSVCAGNDILENGNTQAGCKGDDRGLICHNITFENNTLVAEPSGGGTVSINCAAGTNSGAISAQATVLVTGNIFTDLASSCGIANVSYNYYTTSEVCGSDAHATAGSVSGAKFAQATVCYSFTVLCTGPGSATPYDLHIGAGSGAIGVGNPADYPATDIFGTARSSPPDAGATAH